MVDQNRIIRALLSLNVDKKGLADTEKALKKVQSDLDATRKRIITVDEVAVDLKKELTDLARQDAVKQIGEDFAKAGAEGRDFDEAVQKAVSRLKAIGASEDEIRRVARAYHDAAEEADRAASAGDKAAEATSGGGRNRLGRLGTFGRELKALPSIRLGSLPSTDQFGKIMQTVDAGLTAVGASAFQVAGAAAGAAPFLIALAVATDRFFKTIEASKKLLDGALSAQDAYYEALRENTSEETRAQIAELQRVRPILQQQRDETQAAIDATWEQLVGSLGDAGARALVQSGNSPITQLEEQLKGLDAQLLTNDGTVARLNQGLEQDAFLLNDVNASVEAANQQNAESAILIQQLEDAERKLNKERDLAIFQLERQLVAQSAQLRRDGTVEDVDNRITALHDEADAIKATIGELRKMATTSSEAAQELRETENRLRDINREASVLNSLRADIAVREFAEATRVLNEDLAALDSTRLLRLDELAANLQRGLEDIGAEFQEQEAKNSEKRLESLQRFNEEEIERVKAHRRNLKEINRNFDKSARDAAASLDANALQDAIEARRENVRKENERFKLENEKRAKALRDLKKSLSDQEKETYASYQKRYTALVQQNQREVAATNAKYQADVAMRQAAFNAQTAALQATISQEITLRNFMNNAILNGTSLLLSSVQALFNQTPTGSGSSIVGQQPTPYARGGTALGYSKINDGGGVESGYRRNKLMVFTEPTRIFDAATTRAILSGSGGRGTRKHDITLRVTGDGNVKLPANFVPVVRDALVKILEEEAG